MKESTKSALKGYVGLAITLGLLLSGVPFLAGLAVGFVWFVMFLAAGAIALVIYALRDNIISSQSEYDAWLKFVEALNPPKWRVALGWVLMIFTGWVLYDQGYHVTGYTYVIYSAIFALIANPIKDDVEKTVERYKEKYGSGALDA